MTEKTPRLLCYKDAAPLYGVHWQTIKRWVREGKVAFETMPSGRKRVYAPECTQTHPQSVGSKLAPMRT